MIQTRSMGIVHVPRSPGAWVLAALFAAFCIQVFFVVDARSHSASDTLYGVFPYWVPAFLLWEWIAGRRQPERDGARP